VVQEAGDIEEYEGEDLVGQLGVSLIAASHDRKHNLLKESAKDVVLVVAFEEGAYLLKQLQDFTIQAWVQQGDKDVAEMVLIQVLEEVLLDVDEVLDILRTNREFVEKKVQAAIPSLLVAQQLHDPPQNQVFFLLEVADADVTDLFDHACSPEATEVFVPTLDGEHTEPL